MKNSILIFIVSILCISSCVTNKPVYKLPIEKGKYGVETYNEPEFKSELTPLGKAGSLIILGTTTISGAYAGYSLLKPDITPTWYKGTNYSENKKRSYNGLLGAITGVITGIIINGTIYSVILPESEMKRKHYVYSSSVPKWLDKLNDDLLYIEHGVNEDLTVNHISGFNKNLTHLIPESEFEIKSIYDAKFFKSIYPKSTYFVPVIKNSLINFSNDELLKLNDIFKPNNSVNELLVSKYLEKCNNLNCCLNVIKYDPSFRIKAEEKALSLCSSLEDAVEYSKIFQIKDNESKLEEKTLSLCKSINDIKYFISIYKSKDSYYKAEEKSFSLINSFDSFKDHIDLFPGAKQKKSLEEKCVDNIKSMNDISDYLKIFPSGQLKKQVEIKSANMMTSIKDIKILNILFPDIKNNKELEKKSTSFVNDFSTLKFFAQYYPNSEFSNEVLNKAMSNIRRSYYPELITIYPNSTFNKTIIQNYVNSCITIEDYYEAGNRYPEYKESATRSAFLSCKSREDYQNFIDFFPKSAYTSKAKNFVRSFDAEIAKNERKEIEQRRIKEMKQKTSSQSSGNCDEALTEYEQFVDEYIEFVSRASDGDYSVIANAMPLMQQAESAGRRIKSMGQAQLGSSCWSKYLKIQSKLSKAALKISKNLPKNINKVQKQMNDLQNLFK